MVVDTAQLWAEVALDVCGVSTTVQRGMAEQGAGGIPPLSSRGVYKYIESTVA